MAKTLLAKLKEALISVLPITFIVLILYFTPLVDLTKTELVVFVVSAVLLIIGIALFNLGADLAMTPMGEQIGTGLTKSRKLKLLLPVCFAMGVLITVAEPDLSVLAKQVANVINDKALIFTVGGGVGLFLLIGVLKIVFKRNLSPLLMFSYMLLFAFAALVIDSGKGEFIPLSFDAGGVTTGPITVPFIMALGVGISATVGGKRSNENSFGLVALCSVGPMLAVMILSLTASGSLDYKLSDYSMTAALEGLSDVILATFWEVAKALGLIVIFFAVLQITVLKLPKSKLLQIGIGILYTYVGLVVFLTAVNVGFMPIGFKLGEELSSVHPAIVISFAVLIGAVVVLAEPAVHVLNKQVEEITDGAVSKRSMLIALSVGVGVSIGLSVIRVIYGFSVLYYLIPGYILSLALSFFVPKIYTAIAFDSGGVASGPLTSSFILPFAIGICAAMHGEENVLSSAFGVVAMVAMTPLITIQSLGFKAVLGKKLREKISMRRIYDEGDEQIIRFM